MQTVETTDTPAIDAEIAKARAELEKLRAAAEDARAEAQRWQRTFQIAPDPQSHTNSAVALQRALNAESAARTHESEVLGPLEAKRRASAEQAERARLLAELDPSHIRAAHDRIAQAITSCRTELESAATALHDFLVFAHEARPRATALRIPLAPMKFADVVAEVNARLPQGARFEFIYTGTPGKMRLEMTWPLGVHGALI